MERKAGDEVIVTSGIRDHYIGVVTNVMPSGRFEVGRLTFNPDGSSRGLKSTSFMGRPRVVPWDDKLADEIRAKSLKVKIEYNFENSKKSLTLDQLRRILAIIEEPPSADPNADPDPEKLTDCIPNALAPNTHMNRCDVCGWHSVPHEDVMLARHSPDCPWYLRRLAKKAEENG